MKRDVDGRLWTSIKSIIRVQVVADTLSVLAPAIEARPLSAPLLERWRYVQVKTETRRNDTSVAMIERHYSRWITEGLDEMAARAVVPLIAAAA